MNNICLVSFVLPFGESFLGSQLNTLNQYDNCEFIANHTAAKDIKNIKFLIANDSMEYKNLSTIIASGEWIVFLDSIPKNELINKILKTIKSHQNAFAIAGSEKVIFNKFTICKDTSHSSPIIYNRNYLASLLPISKKNDDRHILEYMYKIGKLTLDEGYQEKHITYAKLYLAIPYFNIIKNRLLDSRIQPNIKQESFGKYIQFDKNIPIFINCRDRLSPLLKLVSWIEYEGFSNIIFIDNKSSYKPLLDYYENTSYTVIKLGRNIGQRAPWISGAINYYASNKAFIVTDPDVIPLESSHGAIKYFAEVLNNHPKYAKVGFGLRIDNLPDSYEPKNNVIKWESVFWKDQIEKDIYIADLDTTFALYRPNTPYLIRPALRTGGRFIAEHEPWYEDSKKPSAEMIYYRKNANKEIGSWGVSKNDISKIYS